MKIGINAFGCNHGRSGVGAYVYSLMHNLPQMQHTVQVFGPQFDKYIYTSDLDPSLYEGVTLDDTDFTEKMFVKMGLNQFAAKMGYDAVLFPSGITSLPISFSKPAFLVVQNLIKIEERFSLLGSFSARSQKNILQKVSGIIAPSKFIKQNLVDFGVDEKKINVIYNGIDTSIFHPKTDDDTSNKVNAFTIRKPYILYASTISEPEKRHLQLIQAFEIFKQKTGLPHRLVIAGSEGNAATLVHNAVLSSPFISDIILTGYIEHNQLAQFYRESDCCVFPSEIEGVGLPVIEAMACGVPTACAEAGALPEIAGDAAVYFDAKNSESIAQALIDITSNDAATTEAKRHQLIDTGLEWVRQFSWQETAQKTFEYITENCSPAL